MKIASGSLAREHQSRLSERVYFNGQNGIHLTGSPNRTDGNPIAVYLPRRCAVTIFGERLTSGRGFT
jgi:hypothetical protein